jgi:hypothetical protein
VRHLGAEEAPAHFAERAHAPAFVRSVLELPQLAWVEVEEAQHQPFGVHHELAPGPVHDLRLEDPRFDAHRGSLGRPIDRRENRFVLVAQRQVQREVEPRAQPELEEFLFE